MWTQYHKSDEMLNYYMNAMWKEFNVIVIHCNSTDSCEELIEFMAENNLDKAEFINDYIFLISHDLFKLKNFIRENYKKKPYMELFINGNFADENT